MQRLPLILLVLATSALPNRGRAEECQCAPPGPKTKLEAFEGRTGTVLIKSTAHIGVFSGNAGTLAVRCREFSDTGSGHRESGLSLVLHESDQVEELTLVDYDELDSLIKGIETLSTLDGSVTSLSGFEASYRSRGGLRIAAYTSRRTGTIEASIRVETRSGPAATVLASTAQLGQLRVLIEQARSRLDSIRKDK